MDFLSKTDLMSQYGVNQLRSFERLIGDRGREILNWSKGHQRFTPRQVRKLHKHLGTPLKREEKLF